MPSNYLAAFSSPTKSQLDRERYSNALLENEAARLPQRNRAEDVAMAADEHSINESQRQTAAGLLATRFAAGAQSQSPKAFAAQFLSDPNFQAAGKLLGLPVEQFTVTDQDTDDALRQSMTEWAAALGQGGQQQRVQSTFVGKDGNQWVVTTDGRTVNTGVPVSQFAQRPVETGAGIEAFDPARGNTGGPISPAATAPALDAAAMARKEAESLGSGRGQNQASFEAGAPQRTERTRQQITSIDNVLSAIDTAAAKIDWNTTGFVGNALKGVPGTPAHDLQQQLLTIQANLGFDRIQQMRESSPTGGALGQVAVQELNALQASVAALAQSQSDQAFRSNLDKVKTHYTNWRNVIVQSQQGGAPNGMPDFSQMTDAQLMQILNEP